MPSYPANKNAPASNSLLISSLCWVMNELYRLIFPLRCIMAQDMKALTLPWMTALQMGHSLKLRAHSPQATRWPQGTNTTDTSLSMHTLHILSSCRRRSCSSVLSWGSSLPKKKKNKQKPKLLVLSQLHSASCDSSGSHTATCPLFCSETVKMAKVLLRQVSFRLKNYSYCRLAYPHKIQLIYTCWTEQGHRSTAFTMVHNYPNKLDFFCNSCFMGAFQSLKNDFCAQVPLKLAHSPLQNWKNELV